MSRASAIVLQQAMQFPMGTIEFRIFPDHPVCKFASFPQERNICQEIRKWNVRQPALAGTHHISRTAQTEVRLGDFETIGRLLQHLEFLHRFRILPVS